VRSLRDQSYPSDLYQIAVIADNCTDDTAVIARKAGADDVLTRHAPDARGKGQALRWALDQVLTWSPVVEAIVVVDADALAERDLIKSLVRKLGLSSPFGGDSSVRKSDLDAGAAEVDHRDQRVGGMEAVGAVGEESHLAI
jgi:cellulose synthase/poly-beta-1,6-N-acetylglucosamine synthase-like glycosyltransferase